MRYYLLIIILCSCLISCSNKSNKETVARSAGQIKTNIDKDTAIVSADTVQESIALDSVNKIDEVRELSKFIDSVSNHKRGVTMLTLHRPDKQKRYFWIQVGYNNGIRFQAYYNFYVYAKDYEIKFLNTVKNDSLMSLADWRRSKRNNIR